MSISRVIRLLCLLLPLFLGACQSGKKQPAVQAFILTCRTHFRKEQMEEILAG